MSIDQATEKLKVEETSADRKDFPVSRITEHLISFMEADAAFSALVMQEHKTLNKCLSYIFDTVRNQYGGSGCICVSDDNVFEMARAYYELDDAEIEQKRQEEKRIQEERAQKRAAEAKEKAEREKAEKSAKKAKEAGQLSLF